MSHRGRPTSGTSIALRRQRGVALIIVMVFVFMSLLMMSGTFELIHQAYVFEESSDRIAGGSDGTEHALGIAIARLQSGIPGTSPYVCRLRLRSTDGSSIEDFKLTHVQLDQDSWTVHAEPTTDSDPTCASHFETSCPLVIP